MQWSDGNEVQWEGYKTVVLHIGNQITVKALKVGEIVDLIIVYSLAINYEKRCG